MSYITDKLNKRFNLCKKNISYRDGVSSTDAYATLFPVEISDERKLGKHGDIEEG